MTKIEQLYLGGDAVEDAGWVLPRRSKEQERRDEDEVGPAAVGNGQSGPRRAPQLPRSVARILEKQICIRQADVQFTNFIPTLFSSFILHLIMAMNGAGANGADAPSGATDAVLKPSDPVPEGAMPVKGIEFDSFKDRNISVTELLEGMTQMGFQASSIGQAAQIVDGMVCEAVNNSGRYSF